METSIRRMTQAITAIVPDSPTIYLYGSAAMGDFRPGWSDIDLLILTRKALTGQQADALLTLRQALPNQYPDAKYARSFEGGILPLDAFLKGYPCNVVYWGTSGQRIKPRHDLSSFDLWELHHAGRLLHGEDVCSILPIPTSDDLFRDVAVHLRAIRQHGRGGPSLYAFGWMLDIARGLYTLRHEAVITKTQAAEWALENHLCPDEEALKRALTVRRDPLLIRQADTLAFAEALTPAIQGFSSVLQAELAHMGITTD